MILGGGAAPEDAATVPVRVQVIDVNPYATDLVVPTYIPVRDLSHRVAMDAGLGAYWQDGTRRTFWFRARGRVLGTDERLEDLGVIYNELLHLLPEPPPGCHVIEQPPAYPVTHWRSASGILHTIIYLMLVGLWASGWALALLVNTSALVTLPCGLGLALMCTSFSRYLWGGDGSLIRVPLTATLIWLPVMVMAFIPSFVALSGEWQVLMVPLIQQLFIGPFGILLGWLAWFGPVEPLPMRPPAQEPAIEPAG